MDPINSVISKLNEIIDVPDYIQRRDCYNTSTTKGPYGFQDIVVFSHGDDPNDTLVIGVVDKDGTVTRIMWNADGWEHWSYE